MIIHQEFVATHDMLAEVPGDEKVCRLGECFLDGSGDPRRGICSNSRLIVDHLPVAVLDFLQEGVMVSILLPYLAFVETAVYLQEENIVLQCWYSIYPSARWPYPA
jgi:hypothetical protein